MEGEKEREGGREKSHHMDGRREREEEREVITWMEERERDRKGEKSFLGREIVLVNWQLFLSWHSCGTQA